MGHGHDHHDCIPCAIDRHSVNTAKWLATIAQAITQDEADQAAVDALKSKIKSDTDALETALHSATD